MVSTPTRGNKATHLGDVVASTLGMLRLPSLMALSRGSSAVQVALVDGPIARDQPDLDSEGIRELASASARCRDRASAACRHVEKEFAQVASQLGTNLSRNRRNPCRNDSVRVFEWSQLVQTPMEAVIGRGSAGHSQNGVVGPQSHSGPRGTTAAEIWVTPPRRCSGVTTPPPPPAVTLGAAMGRSGAAKGPGIWRERDG
jgi:hypothetical protein